MRLRIIGIFTLLLSGALAAFGQEYSSNSKPLTLEVSTIEYCELMKKPESYFGKTIRVEAVLTNLISNEGILWAECGKDKSAISVGFADAKFDELAEQILDKMNSWRVSDAKVIVIGKFYGPRSPESKFNYGHMGWSKYLFEITTLEKIERVPKKQE